MAPEPQYLLLTVLQGAPEPLLVFVDHGLVDNRIKLVTLGEKTVQVGGVPRLEDAEESVQHDAGRNLLPVHNAFRCLVREMI